MGQNEKLKIQVTVQGKISEMCMININDQDSIPEYIKTLTKSNNPIGKSGNYMSRQFLEEEHLNT